MNTVNNLPDTIGEWNAELLDFTGAKRSYSGKRGCCCCGCSGNYSEHKPAVTRQINLIKKLVKKGQIAEVGSNNIAVENGNRIYIVYFD